MLRKQPPRITDFDPRVLFKRSLNSTFFYAHCVPQYLFFDSDRRALISPSLLPSSSGPPPSYSSHIPHLTSWFSFWLSSSFHFFRHRGHFILHTLINLRSVATLTASTVLLRPYSSFLPTISLAFLQPPSPSLHSMLLHLKKDEKSSSYLEAERCTIVIVCL